MLKFGGFFKLGGGWQGRALQSANHGSQRWRAPAVIVACPVSEGRHSSLPRCKHCPADCGGLRHPVPALERRFARSAWPAPLSGFTAPPRGIAPPRPNHGLSHGSCIQCKNSPQTWAAKRWHPLNLVLAIFQPPMFGVSSASYNMRCEFSRLLPM
jgi:hypothetical protein